jgi:hypothetical protein
MISPGDIKRKSFHNTVYFVSLSLIAISLPSSRYLLTVSEILLAVNWLAEADFRARFIWLMSSGCYGHVIRSMH